TDDQRARAEGVAELGAAIISRGHLESETANLLLETTRVQLRTSCERLPSASGGVNAAQLIYEQALSTSDQAKVRQHRGPKRPIVDARASTKKGDITNILFTENVPENFLDAPTPVEHFISDSSLKYQKERRRIANWLYRFDN